MKILLAVDSSEYSAIAIKEVAKRPWPSRSTVRVLSAVEPLTPPAAELWYDGGGDLEIANREMRKHATELTKATAAKLHGRGFKIEDVVRVGHPRTAIVDEARKWSADLIVLGSHGRTGLKRLLLGSVALSVVTHAPCSVEVIRPKRTKSRGEMH
jgi:nucleotide-binding universal stress UspA family protein